MNRTKKMMLVTFMATTAISMLLMAKGLAAPAVTGTCPNNQAIQQMLSNGVTNGTMTSYMNSADLRALLSKYGIANTTCPTGKYVGTTCRVAVYTAAKCNTGACKTSTCPKQTPAPAPAPKPTTPPVTPKPTTPPVTPKPTTPPITPKPTTPPVTPKPTTPPVSGSMSAEESNMVNLVNQERTSAGLQALNFDSTLRAGAMEHSRDMSSNNYFSHTSPTSGGFSQRLAASGAKYSAAGENIALYGSVEKAHVGLMNSPGHRANIMNVNFTRIGIAIVWNADKGAYYITQWFAK